MAEELLYRADVRAPVEQMRRERVAQDMGALFFLLAHLGHFGRNDPFDVAPREPFAF
jgi:hypothetical protein